MSQTHPSTASDSSGAVANRASCSLLVWVVLMVVAASPATAAKLTTLTQTGESSNRVDLIFLGDGYVSDEIETVYSAHVSAAIDYMFGVNQNPLPRYRNFFNIHRIDVISNESGADIPQQGITKDTALDASYRFDGETNRLLSFSSVKAYLALIEATSGTGIDYNMRVGIVNESVYGGAGGAWAVYAGGNSSASEIAMHELGHSFAGLGDEYYTIGEHYTGNEPLEPNVTTSPDTGKWDRWLGYDDPDSNIGPIGYYQGADDHETGLYRPSDGSKMRFLGRAFDAVSREAVIKNIYAYVDPLDDWLDETVLLSSSDTAWVDVVDESVIGVEWLLDGTPLEADEDTIDIRSLGLGRGEYTLTARAYDTLLNHSFTGDHLDWWRSDPSTLSQSVSWNLSIAVPEPSSCLLIGLIGFGQVCRRNRKAW